MTCLHSRLMHSPNVCCLRHSVDMETTVKVEQPSAFKYFWQKGHRAFHGDGQHRDPHTSLKPASWGLALQPRPLAPNPLLKSSTNLCVSPSLSTKNARPSTLPSLRPDIGLQHSWLRHMALRLSPWSPGQEIGVPAQCQHSSLAGVLLEGFPVAFSCQHGTITAAQQSLAVTGGRSARGEAPIWLCCGGATFELSAPREANYYALCWESKSQRDCKGGMLPSGAFVFFFSRGHCFLSIWLSEVVLHFDHTRAILPLN